MVVSIIIRVAISCGVVIVYSIVGKYLVSFLGLRRHPKPYPKPHEQEKVAKEEDDEDEEEDVVQSETSASSPDAIHLLRLSNAFCPPGIEPSIFGYNVNLSGHKTSSYSDELDDDNFSDVLEESSFCLRDSFEHGHTHRISIKAPAFVHQPSTAEISSGGHKSASSERRSSTTFAPEIHHENGSNPACESGNRKKKFSYHPKHSCESEPIGALGQLTSKRKKLFRPSLNALRRLNQSKQVHQVEQPKLFTSPTRIDYMSTVRSRFKLISSKKLTLKPVSKGISHSHADVRNSEVNGARLSSVFFSSV